MFLLSQAYRFLIREKVMNIKIILGTLIAMFMYTGVSASGFVPYVFNLPACQTAGSGIFIADVGHRYLDTNRHTTNINLALTYGIFNPLDITAAYSFKNKDIIGSMKLNIFNDFSGSDWIGLSLYGGAGYKDTNQVNNTVSMSAADDSNVEAVTTLDSKDRASYFGQVVIQKHMFGNRFSLGVVPSYAYNTNFYQIESKSDYSAGLGIMTEIYITDSLSMCGEAIMNLAGFAFKYMNYNGGFKYAGYRHTFSLWVTNSNGYSPVEYMAGSEELTPKISGAFTREFD